MPRKRHVSRNSKLAEIKLNTIVMPRKRHVSRNWMFGIHAAFENVMPRKRHVSRNVYLRSSGYAFQTSCLARGM